MSVRGVVLGLNGQRQGFDRAQVQGGRLLRIHLFAFNAAQVPAERMEDAIDDWRRHQQRPLPPQLFDEE